MHSDSILGTHPTEDRLNTVSMNAELLRLTRQRDLLLAERQDTARRYQDLQRKIRVLQAELARQDFTQLVRPLTWSPVLTDDLKGVHLVAGAETPEEHQALNAIVKGFCLNEGQADLGIPGVFLHLEASELVITASYIDYLLTAAQTLSLNIDNDTLVLEKIDHKVASLTALREMCTRLRLL